jgi:thiamine biosynthesis protein ThiS
VKIRLNGAERVVDDAITVDALVGALKLDRAVIAVEKNRVVIRRGTYAEATIGEGDEIEIVTLVGGG